MPCGEHTLSIKTPRYKPHQQKIVATPEEPFEAKVVLARPTFVLRLLSRPKGATVYVGGRRVGKTPRQVRVLGYETARIKVVKKGYATWTRSVYMKKRKTTVLATMKRRKSRSGKKRR